MKSLALFNNKASVGKTTLAFNLAHLFARRGLRTVALDYDPQCNLSAMFLSPDELVGIWEEDESIMDSPEATEARTVGGCIDLIRRRTGDLREPVLVPVADDLWLLPGHLGLSRFERELADEWPKIAAFVNERALDVTTALDLLSNAAAEQVDADIVIIDVGPGLGALNRAALLACDAVVIPLAPDVFSLQGLAHVGPALREWRDDWGKVNSSRLRGKYQELLPIHRFQPIGYIVQQRLPGLDGVPSDSRRWASSIPGYFHAHVLDEPSPDLSIEADEQCIAVMEHVASLIPIARMARKPVCSLGQGDGARDEQAVVAARAELELLIDRLSARLDEIPEAVSAAIAPAQDRGTSRAGRT